MRPGAVDVDDERPPVGPPEELPWRPRRRLAATAGDALEGALTAISAAGVETPRLDAELIVASVLGVSRERLLLEPGLEIPPELVRLLQAAVRRRAVDREPVAYITGRRWFRRLELSVDARVLVPRPETELLVEVGVELLPAGARVLDVGTGSGAVALALKDERPDLQVSGSDVSAEALEVAAANARRLGLEVRWLLSDLLAQVADDQDAVLANLPYVAERDRVALAPEIVRHEPPRALFGGSDGLETIRALSGALAARPRVRLAALEVGAGQAAVVAELLRGAGFERVSARRDLAGVERVVVARRSG